MSGASTDIVGKQSCGDKIEVSEVPLYIVQLYQWKVKFDDKTKCIVVVFNTSYSVCPINRVYSGWDCKLTKIIMLFYSQFTINCDVCFIAFFSIDQVQDVVNS